MSKALIRDVDNTIEAFEVQFNPNSLEYSVGTNYRSTKGSKKTNGKSTLSDDESAQSDPSGKTGSASLSVTLFYHTYTDEDTYSDVRDQIKKIRRFIRGSGNSGKNDLQMKFTWGTFSFEGVVSSFRATYQMFAADGTPVQAEVAITIEGEDPDYTASTESAGKKLKAKQETSDQAADQVSKLCSWLFG